MRLGGFLSRDMRDHAGYDCDEVRTGGYSASNVVPGGYSVQDVCCAGYTTAEALAAGLKIDKLREVGYTAADLLGDSRGSEWR